MGSLGGEDSKQGSGWQSRQSHICVQINWEEQLGSETDHTTQGASKGKEASKPLTEKTYQGCSSRRNPQPHKRVCWRDPQGNRMYTFPPT